MRLTRPATPALVPDVGRVISFGAGRELYVITAGNKIYRIARQ